MHKTIARLLLLALALLPAAAAAVENGWWWNPAQGGRGFSIEIQSNQIFMAGYLYADDGSATWLVSGGAMSGPNDYTGALQSFRGGQMLVGAYQPAALANGNVGSLTLHFTDATHGTLSWPGGTIPIERFQFGSGTPSFKPETGWYWNAAEGGRGFAIEVQGSTLVMAGYMYDGTGNPTWYYSAGSMATSTLYVGNWESFRGGQTLTGPYHAPTDAGSAGSLSVVFNSTISAILTLPDGRAINLSRFTFAPPTTLPPSSSFAKQCAAPRSNTAVDPTTNRPYNDTQASLDTEKAWIRSWVNETYLWYQDVPFTDPAAYYLGANVTYVSPSNNVRSTVVLASVYGADDAFFNSQRSPLTTASGKPKDQFHFTYPTDTWVALSSSGSTAGFGMELVLLAASPPRDVRVSFSSPNTPAAQAGIARGASIVTVNGVSVRSGTDLATLNEGLFSPVSGKSYTFEIQDLGATATRTVTLTAGPITLTPVMNVGTLPAPNDRVGYIHFTDHIATSERGLVDAVAQLAAANGGAGVQDLILDMRYNGGGFLDIASELAFMIAGPSRTSGKVFETLSFNDKNPFGFTAAEAATPFWSQARGFSVALGQGLPSLNLPRVYVVVSASTCSASEAVINGLRGAGVDVVLIGGTTCGKPYGFFATDNCSTTYFTIQFKGVNNFGFGDYADGFSPDGAANPVSNTSLAGCQVADDFTHALGDPAEARIAAALQFRASGTCPAKSADAKSLVPAWSTDLAIARPALRENRFILPSMRAMPGREP